MKEVGLYEAKSKLSALVAQVESSGEKVLLTRHGKVVAELCPPEVVTAPQRGLLKATQFEIANDFDKSELGFEDFFEEKSVDYSNLPEAPSSRVAEGETPYKA